MRIPKAVKVVNLFIITISFLLISSCEDVTNSNQSPQTFSIPAWDYSDSHYFLDTIYKQSYLDYYNNVSLSSHTDSLKIDDQNFEVWVQTDVTTTGYRKAGLHVDLPILPPGGQYSSEFRTVPDLQQGIRTFGIVRKLLTEEYRLNKYAGYISLKINVPENYFVGVAYKRPMTGEQFGTSSIDTNTGTADTLVLKMIKVQNLVPANLIAWELK
ncbi:MAG: hypothetical protein ABI462_03515 [Ignavibacteria bacterium]